MEHKIMENNNPILEAALRYAERGWSVIPVGNDKKPLIEWREYQTERATPDQIKKWYEQFPNAGVAIVTGKISKIVVVDVDDKNADTSGLPSTVTARTGREEGGYHLYYKYEGEMPVLCGKLHPKIDVKGEGGIVVAPPSPYKDSGRFYEWVVSPDDSDFAELPKLVIERNSIEGKKTDWKTFLEQVKPEGIRTMSATQYAGLLLHYLPTKLWDSVGWQAMCDFNTTHNEPPLPEKDIRKVWRSIRTKEFRKRASTEENENLSLLPLVQLMKKEFAAVAWIVDNLIPHEAITVISGAPAAYKTWLVLDIALRIAGNSILFDKFPTTSSPVLIIDEENGERLLQQRIKMLCKNFEVPVFIISLKSFRLNTEAVKKIISLTQQYGIKVVIFDSLIRIHGEDENDATKMASVFKNLKELSKNGLAVLLTHHNRKQGILRSSNPSQEMRGSSDILASADCHIAVERKQKENFIIVTQTKLRQAEEMKPFKLNIVNDGDTLRFEFAGEIDEAQTKRADCKEAVKSLLEEKEEPLSKIELFKLLKEAGIPIGYSTFKNATKEMVENGELFEKKGIKNKTLCSIKPFDSGGG